MAYKFFLKTVSILLSMLIMLSCIFIQSVSASSDSIVYDITISGTDQQTVKGWGVFPSWNRADWNRYFIDKTGAQQALLNDMGATMFRIMLPAVCGDGDGNLVEVKMQEVYDLVRVCNERGMSDYLISVWSPPINMKTLPTVNGWTGTEHVKLRTDKEDTYCNYLVNAIQWLIGKGLTKPKAISFQNEPLSQIISEWCYWGGDNGAQYQRVAKNLRSKLDVAGLADIQILGPEGACYRENEQLLGEGFSALKNDPVLYNAISGLASHSYYSKGFDNTGVYQAYEAACSNIPDKDRWQTEYCPLITNISDIDMAINTAQRLISDMALVKNNYWFYWLGWAAGRQPSDAGEVLLNGDGYTVTKSKTYYVLSKIFNNVAIGSKVRRADIDSTSGLITSDNVWMDAVAFLNGNKTVALITNATNETKTVNVKGLTGISAEVYQTTADQPTDEDMRLAAIRNIISGTAGSINLPARSVTVVVTSAIDTAAPNITFDQKGSSSAYDAEYAVRTPAFTVSGHLDETGALTINDIPVVVEDDLTFQTSVNLQQGINIITAVATDSSGNTGDPQTIIIRYDPAYLGLTVDQKSTKYTNLVNYTVSGKTNGDAIVNIKQQCDGNLISEQNITANVDQRSGFAAFDAVLDLEEGGNTIIISATNGSDEQAVPATIHAIYDTAPPVINVPLTDTASSTSYVLKGSISEAAAIKINGLQVNATSDNTFVSVVQLQSGLNEITVEATDPAGNTSCVVVNVTCNPIVDGVIGKGVAAANRVSGTVNVDGSLDESQWKVDNKVQKMIVGTSDNSVTFGTLWDDNNLYVGVKVLDIDLKNDSDRAYQDDSIEIYIDGDNTRSTIYNTDDQQITLGWHDTQLFVGGNIPGIQFSQKDIDGGFTVEMSIPWSGIGIDPPKPGSVIGFDIGNNDDDGHNSGNRESQLMWNGTADNWKDTSAFGSLYLNDGRNTAVAAEVKSGIVVDGLLDESSWRIADSVNKSIVGTPNNNVKFGALCDDQYLYIGVEVLDTELRNDSDRAYQDDSVEVYIDANNNRGTIYDLYDHQITLGWQDNQLSMIGNISGIEFSHTDISGGYSIEMAIPWTGLNIIPKRDITLGFDIGNNDDDGHNNGNRESQLMWNGTADNWKDTSAFGSLLLHNMNYPLPEVEIPDPEGLVTFTDECRDLTRVYEKTADIINTNFHPENYSGDADRIGHRYDNPSSPEYVVYKSPYGDIYSFDVITGLFSSTPNFAIYGSSDGVNYQKITAATKLTGGANGYSVFSNTAINLPEGTKYLKVQFPGKENWKEQLCKVSFKYFGESEDAVKAIFTDECADLTQLYDRSGKIGIANWKPENFGNDSSRIVHTNDDIINPEYVVYKSPGKDIYTLDVTVSQYCKLPVSTVFAMYGSPDGINFSKLNINPEMISSTAGYDTKKFALTYMDRGIRYLKIEFPYGTADCDGWTSHINRVSFTYGAEPVTGVTLDKTQESLLLDSVMKLTASVTPENATNKNVAWSSSNPEVVIVDENGTVTGTGLGTAEITVTTQDGLKTAKCTVNVLPVLDRIILLADKTVLKSNESTALAVEGMTADGIEINLDDAQIAYSSDNEQVAAVDSDGNVAAISEGIANISVSVNLYGITKETRIGFTVDTTPTQTVCTVDGNSNNGWYVSDAAITLNATDNLSGVEKTEYRFGDTGEWQIYNGPFNITMDGISNIQYYSEDKAGNIENIRQETIKIDKIAPVTTEAATGIIRSDGTYNSYVEITLSAADAIDGSGVSKTEYSLDGINWLAYTMPVVLKENGTYSFNYKTTDNAGNVESIKNSNIVIAMDPDVMTSYLVEIINEMKLEHGISNSLIKKLENVVQSIQGSNTNSAVNKLEAFINEVKAQSSKKLTEEQANELIASANKIISVINFVP